MQSRPQRSQWEDLHSFVPEGVDRTCYQSLIKASHDKNMAREQKRKLRQLAAVVCISDTSLWDGDWGGVAPSMLTIIDWFITLLCARVRRLIDNNTLDSRGDTSYCTYL